jgi:hypothetical protein
MGNSTINEGFNGKVNYLRIENTIGIIRPRKLYLTFRPKQKTQRLFPLFLYFRYFLYFMYFLLFPLFPLFPLSICLSIYLSVYPSIHNWLLCMYVCMYVCMHAWMYILYIYICVCVCVCVSVEYIFYIYLCVTIYIYTSLHSTPLHAKLIQPIVNYCNSTSKKKHSNLPLLWIRILPFYLFGVAIVQPTASIHLDKISWFTNLKKKARPFQRGIDIYIYVYYYYYYFAIIII